jgi:hypothetical protein
VQAGHGLHFRPGTWFTLFFIYDRPCQPLAGVILLVR